MSTNLIEFSVTPSELIPMIDYWTSRLNSKGEKKKTVAPFIWGGPGIGKTDIVRTMAASRNSRIVALHLPQFDPTDIKGIPVRDDDGRVRWVPSTYLPQQMRTLVGSDRGLSTVLNWEYAVDVAVYGFDEHGEIVLQQNDSVEPDIGKVDANIKQLSTTQWSVNIKNIDVDVKELVLVDKAVIFLDELSAAEPNTQNTALQLVLDRRVGEYDVPYGVPMIAAGNREEDGAFVQTLSHPLANRFAHITLIPNADDFIEWGMYNNIRPEILGFVKAYPDALYSYDPSSLVNGSYGFSTPRSLAFLSDQYEDIDFFKKMSNAPDKRKAVDAERLRLIMFQGIIGKKEASRFISYLQIVHDLPSADDVISGRITEFGDVERSQSFSLLYSLIQNLKTLYDKYAIKGAGAIGEEQPDEWSIPRDRIFDFITNNYNAESGSWAGRVILNQMKFEAPTLRSDALARFSTKYVDVMSRIRRNKK